MHIKDNNEIYATVKEIRACMEIKSNTKITKKHLELTNLKYILGMPTSNKHTNETLS